MTKNQLIYGGIGGILLIGGIFVFMNSNTTPTLELKQPTSNQANTQATGDIDIFKDSMLSQAEIASIKEKNPELVRQLSQGYASKPISSQNTINSNTGQANNIVFIPVPQHIKPNIESKNVNKIDYTGLNPISTNIEENNKKLAKLKIEADKKYKETIQQQQNDFRKIYQQSSQPDFGNNQKVPKEQIAFFKNIKQQEFQSLMETLNHILPTHPNKVELEKQVKQYNDYYAKLQKSIDSNNVTYGMLLQHDAQHKKIVGQVHQIHNSFIGYTSNLYKNQKEETDAEFERRNPSSATPTNSRSAQNINPSAAQNVSANPSAQKDGSKNQNPNSIQSLTGNAFR